MKRRSMIRKKMAKGLVLLLALCTVIGSLLIVPVSFADDDLSDGLKDFVTGDNVSGYDPEGNPKKNPWEDTNNLGKASFVADDDPTTIWGWPFEAGMNLVCTFDGPVTVSSIYVECKEEGQPKEGVYGIYKIELKTGVSEENDGWELLKEGVEAHTKKQGGVTVPCDPVKVATAARVTITAWHTTDWGGISKLSVFGTETEASDDPGLLQPGEKKRVTLVKSDDEWSYVCYTDGTDKEGPEGWNTEKVDLTGEEWTIGQAPFTGKDYPFKNANTTLEVGQNDKGKAFFVKKFDVNNPDEITDLVLKLLYDEGPEVYLNGQKIFGTEKPTDYNSDILQVNPTGTIELQDGENVLAVSMHNTVGGFHFALELTGLVPADTDPNPDEPVDVVLVPSGSDWEYMFYTDSEEVNDKLGVEWEQRDPDGWGTQDIDTAGWKKGQAPFTGGSHPGSGYKTQINVQCTEAALTAYFVKTFDVDDPERFGDFILSLYYDEDPEVYLNGEKIFALSDGEGNNYNTSLQPVQPTGNINLKKGKNVLAVLMKNAQGVNAGGFHFDLELSGTKYPADEPGTDYTAGDITGDGYVTVRDVSRLLMYLEDETVTYCASTDVNGSGETDIEDVTALLDILAGV